MAEKAWHFLSLNEKGLPALRSGEPLEPVTKQLVHPDHLPLLLCKQGFHASTRAIDALTYAPGPYVTLVEVDGEILRDEDKLVARRRRALWGYDASPILQSFARLVALDAWEKYAPDLPMPDVVRRWLEEGDESIRSAAESAARSAARSAAESAAWSAARSAAWSAAASAARSAARSAAWSAAESAAWSAAWSAAESAARDEQNRILESMLIDGRPE